MKRCLRFGVGTVHGLDRLTLIRETVVILLAEAYMLEVFCERGDYGRVDMDIWPRGRRCCCSDSVVGGRVGWVL